MSFIIILTEDGIGWVHCHLVLSSVSNQPLGICEANIAWSGAVALVIRDDFHLPVLEHSHTGVGCPEVDTNCVSLGHFVLNSLEIEIISGY